MCISSLPQAKWNLQSLQQLSWDNEVWCSSLFSFPHRSILPPLHPSTSPSLNLSTLHLSIPQPIHPFTYPSLNLSIPSPIHPSTLHLSIPPPSHMHTQPVYHLTRQPLLLYLAHIVLVENARLLGHRAVRTIFPVETNLILRGLSAKCECHFCALSLGMVGSAMLLRSAKTAGAALSNTVGQDFQTDG